MLLDLSIFLNYIQISFIFASCGHGGFGGPPTLKPHRKRPVRLRWIMYTSFSTVRYNLFDTLLYIDVIMALAEPKSFPKTSYKAKSHETMKLADTLVIFNNRSDFWPAILDLQFWINKITLTCSEINVRKSCEVLRSRLTVLKLFNSTPLVWTGLRQHFCIFASHYWFCLSSRNFSLSFISWVNSEDINLPFKDLS